MGSSQSGMVRIHTSHSRKFFLQLPTWFHSHSFKWSVCHFFSSSCNTCDALWIKQSAIVHQCDISHPLLVLINQPSVCLVSPGYFKTHEHAQHLCDKRGQSFLLCKDKLSLSLCTFHTCITDSLTATFLCKLWAAVGFQQSSMLAALTWQHFWAKDQVQMIWFPFSRQELKGRSLSDPSSNTLEHNLVKTEVQWLWLPFSIFLGGIYNCKTFHCKKKK